MFILKRELLWMGVIGALLSAGAHAQSGSQKAWGQFFIGAGGAVNGDAEGFLHPGGGGTFLFARGLGIEAEIGAVGLFDDFGGSAIGVLSPGLTYVFNRDRKTTPFLSGGYSLFFRDSTASGMYVGGGASRWLNEHVGLRFEVRDQILLEGHTIHFLEGRFSILLR